MNNILALQTSDNFIRLTIIKDQQTNFFERQVDRQMSRQILEFIKTSLDQLGLNWTDLNGIIVFRGEGGYTSLRIGITVANTLANGLNIAIVGQTGQNWLEEGRVRLNDGQNDQIVLPLYKNPAVITKPKK